MPSKLIVKSASKAAAKTASKSTSRRIADASLLSAQRSGTVLHLRLSRPAKRNAINDALVQALQAAFQNLPKGVHAVLLSGEGEHFCAGLDLNELGGASAFEGVLHSRMWHAAMDTIQFSPVPVVAVLHGAVVGGGLELASAAHLRIAEDSTFYALPEGQRGLFVGGGASVRVPRLIGFTRMTDLMLTGRTLNADEGQEMGLSHYRTANGAGLAKGLELAHKIANNAPLSNYAIIQALPRIADMSRNEGLFVESLMAAIAQSDDGAKLRMRAFLDGRASKVKRS